MIEAKYYQFIYLLIVSIVTLAVKGGYFLKSTDETGDGKHVNAFLLLLFMVLFIGFRPLSYIFVDTMNYVFSYQFMEGVPYLFDPAAENFLFDNLFGFFAANRWGITPFFLLISLIYFGGAFVAIRRLFPNDTLLAYLVFLAAFSTFTYGTNGVKAGAAVSLFLLALSYRDKLPVCFFLLWVSLGFHHSMAMPISAFVLTLFFKDPKYYFAGWAVSVLMAAAHVSFFQNLFAGFADDRGADYLTATASTVNAYISGFRLDFILYSAMPVWVGYIAKFKKGIQSMMYDTLLYTYITANAVWMLCMYASFTNRIAYLSWGLYPVVLIYPFFLKEWGEARYQTLSRVVGFHLAFTLFMEMIYYGGLMKLLF